MTEQTERTEPHGSRTENSEAFCVFRYFRLFRHLSSCFSHRLTITIGLQAAGFVS
jgi:hypothetical protein